MIVLMPDGQRLLFQCFDVSSCARGFRVPALLEVPSDPDGGLFETLRDAANRHRYFEGSTRAAAAAKSAELQEEAVIMINSRSTLDLTPYVAKLPRGPYSWSFQRVGPSVSIDLRTFDQDLTYQRAIFPIVGPGLYEIRIIDPLHYSREDLYVLAVSSDSSAVSNSSFLDAKRCLSSWDEIAAGWPVHELLRLDLEALARESAILR